MLLPQASSFGEGLVFEVLQTRLLLVKFIDQVPRFALKMRILVMTPLMVMSPSFSKTVLVLSFDFGLTGSKLLLIEIGELTNSPTLCLKCVLLNKIR